MRNNKIQYFSILAAFVFCCPFFSLAQSANEYTFLPFPAGESSDSEKWKDSLRRCIESDKYAYVCIEGNAIDMMYNNQYVTKNPIINDLIKENYQFPVHELQAPCNYNDLLCYMLECMRSHNSSHNSFIQAVGLSFVDIPYIGFYSRVWHVSKYNKTGMTDSLMAYLADEESDNVRLIELTVDKLNRDQKSLKKTLGELDYFVWKQYFTIQAAHYRDNDPLLLDKLQCEYFIRFNQVFKGRKLVIGCPRLIGMIRDSFDEDLH